MPIAASPGALTAEMVESALDGSTRLGIIGCGTMGRCVLSALLDSGTLKGTQVRGTVAHEENVSRLQKLYPDSAFSTDNQAVCQWANLILLCLKPQMVQEFLTDAEIQPTLQDKLLVSIAAGVRLAQYREWVPAGCQVVRAMPNTPCQIREGMVVLCCPPKMPNGCREKAMALMLPLGRCRMIAETHMDAVTALSGSGPAFACVIMEALADGGVMMGLPRSVAVEVAAQALQGAARMVLQSGQHPAQIKDSVTTPAGCTIAGILTMEDGKIRSVLARTIEEATKVAGTLGQAKK